MDEGVILRSIFALLIKLKSCYANSITSHIVGAISSFFRNLSDGSRIIAYFRKYDVNSPLIAKSYFMKILPGLKTVFIKSAGLFSGAICGLIEGSSIISYFNSAFRHIENNILRSAGIFTGAAAAAYMAASVFGGDIDRARLVTGICIIAAALVLAVLPFDIRKAAGNSIFCRLLRYIFS